MKCEKVCYCPCWRRTFVTRDHILDLYKLCSLAEINKILLSMNLEAFCMHMLMWKYCKCQILWLSGLQFRKFCQVLDYSSGLPEFKWKCAVTDKCRLTLLWFWFWFVCDLLNGAFWALNLIWDMFMVHFEQRSEQEWLLHRTWEN